MQNGMNVVPALLICRKIQDGMFSNERHVTISRADGTTSGYFVPRETVVDRSLRVQRYSGTNFVRIPTCEPEAPVEIRPEDIDAQ